MIYEHDDALRSMIRRARLLELDDSGSQQLLGLSGYAKERLKKIVHVQPHGFASAPNNGADGILLQLAGRSDRSMFFGGEHEDYRQKNLVQRQAVLYDDKGNVVYMMRDRIRIKTSVGIVEIESHDNKIWIKPGDNKKVYLGGDGEDGTYGVVATDAGPAMNVLARVA